MIPTPPSGTQPMERAAPKLNRDGRLVVAITFFSLMANLAMFVVVMCCWKGCAAP